MADVHNTTTVLASEAKKQEEVLVRAEELKDVMSRDVAVSASAEAISLHQRLGRLKVNLTACDKAAKELKGFFDSLHQVGEDVSDFHTVVERLMTADFDEDGFQTAHPRLWRKYLQTKERSNQRFVLADLNSFKKDVSLVTPGVIAVTDPISSAVTGGKPSKAELAEIHGLYLELLSVQSPLDWESAMIEAEIKTLCGDASGIEGVCTWGRTMSQVTTFDKTSFKDDHPDKWDQFTTAKPAGTSTLLRRDRNYRA